MYKIAITNSKLCEDLEEQIIKLNHSDYDTIILREKNMNPKEYEELAKRILASSCKNIILHNFVDVARSLNCLKIHLPLEVLIKRSDDLKRFDVVGASIHSVEEALSAKKMGATYLTASHIFPTSCKEGVPARGLDFLREIVSVVDIPVYALGGVNDENCLECIKAGAKGFCMMSRAMI